MCGVFPPHGVHLYGVALFEHNLAVIDDRHMHPGQVGVILCPDADDVTDLAGPVVPIDLQHLRFIELVCDGTLKALIALPCALVRYTLSSLALLA